jgi:DNA-binding transcriptional ArsR family regulator
VIETFAALAEPNRFRIVELLRSGARSVNEIGERLALNQPQVSKHLRVLKHAGLVAVEPRAQQRVYDLRAQPLRAMSDWLDRYRQLWDTRFEALDQLLVDMQAQQHEMQKEKKKERRHERTKRHRK